MTDHGTLSSRASWSIWFDHATQHDKSRVPWRWGGHRKNWSTNAKEWTGHFMQDLLTFTKNRLCQPLSLCNCSPQQLILMDQHNCSQVGTSQKMYRTQRCCVAMHWPVVAHIKSYFNYFSIFIHGRHEEETQSGVDRS